MPSGRPSLAYLLLSFKTHFRARPCQTPPPDLLLPRCQAPAPLRGSPRTASAWATRPIRLSAACPLISVMPPRLAVGADVRLSAERVSRTLPPRSSSWGTACVRGRGRASRPCCPGPSAAASKAGDAHVRFSEDHRDTQTSVEMFANLCSQLRDCLGFCETTLVILFYSSLSSWSMSSIAPKPIPGDIFILDEESPLVWTSQFGQDCLPRAGMCHCSRAQSRFLRDTRTQQYPIELFNFSNLRKQS